MNLGLQYLLIGMLTAFFTLLSIHLGFEPSEGKIKLILIAFPIGMLAIKKYLLIKFEIISPRSGVDAVYEALFVSMWFSYLIIFFLNR